jgi:NADP-dependent 3-hydroxy acid dehydrogenase YdfG
VSGGEGLTVLAGSRTFERDQAAAKEIGPGAIALQFDVNDRVSIADAAERIRQEFGRLDQLVQNAAIAYQEGQLFRMGAAQLARIDATAR